MAEKLVFTKIEIENLPFVTPEELDAKIAIFRGLLREEYNQLPEQEVSEPHLEQ